MARPKKAAHEVRSEVLYLRVTPDEKQHIEQQADIAGLSPTDFAREFFQGAKLAALPHSAKVAKVEAAKVLLAIDQLTLGVKQVGNNVNQLSRATHRGSDFVHYWQEIGGQLEGTLQQLQTTLDQVGAAYDPSNS